MTARSPKDLLDAENMKLQQIMEEEHENLLAALSQEMKKLSQKEEAELVLFKAREELEQRRHFKDL